MSPQEDMSLVSISSELLTFARRKTMLLDLQLSKTNVVVPSFLFIKKRTKCYSKDYTPLVINNLKLINVHKEVYND